MALALPVVRAQSRTFIYAPLALSPGALPCLALAKSALSSNLLDASENFPVSFSGPWELNSDYILKLSTYANRPRIRHGFYYLLRLTASPASLQSSSHLSVRLRLKFLGSLSCSLLAKPPDSLRRHFCRHALLRKEVIQPHLPIRLPCYDFTPIINPTFDCALPALNVRFASGSLQVSGCQVVRFQVILLVLQSKTFISLSPESCFPVS